MGKIKYWFFLTIFIYLFSGCSEKKDILVLHEVTELINEPGLKNIGNPENLIAILPKEERLIVHKKIYGKDYLAYKVETKKGVKGYVHHSKNMELIKNNEWVLDKTESEVGIHLLLPNGNHVYISNELSWELIRKTLNGLDWDNNFYQFVVVTKPGISMEVGGSLNGIDGLSAMYRDRHKRVDAVIKEPPESVYEMEKILEEFLKPNNVWMEKYDFEFTYY